ncbi:MAG: protein kinase, partial [Candidatus Eremiobacterota bacterium]
LARAQKLEQLVAATPSQASFVGRTLGGYTLVDELGGGGMARVFRGVPADTLDDDQAVAIKVLHRDYAQDPELQMRFRREVRLCRELNHPHIVRLLDWGEQDGVTYLVLELVRGKTLRDRLPPHPLTPEEAFDLLDPILDAVSYAHSMGIVHRDLKPENVMLTDSGTVKVMDFGLARRQQSQSNLTRTGATLGTPAYMAPEQARGGRLDPASDQYSLGVLAYEILTAQKPFQGEDPLQVILQHLGEEPPPPSQIRRDLPPGVERAVLRMLAKQPGDRFPDLAAARAALLSALRAWHGEWPAQASN